MPECKYNKLDCSKTLVLFKIIYFGLLTVFMNSQICTDVNLNNKGESLLYSRTDILRKFHQDKVIFSKMHSQKRN